MGISQIGEGRRRASTLARTTSGLGLGDRAHGSILLSRRVPHQPRVEGLGREHRQDDDRGEGHGADAGSDGDHRPELHQRHEDRDHEDVDHRPAADRPDEAEQGGPVAQPPRPACLGGDQHGDQADQLEHGHDDAGEEHQGRERVHAAGEELLHPAEDRAGSAGAELDHGEDGIGVRRPVEHQGGGHQRPGPRDAVRLARVQVRAAAPAARLGVRDGQAGQPAGLAADGPGRRPVEGNRGVVDRLAGEAARLHLLPDRLPVEDGIGHDRRQHQRAERVERRADLDVDEVDQLHVGDEDAEQIDLDHRPGAQLLEPGEEPPQVRAAGAAAAGSRARRSWPPNERTARWRW